MNWLGQQSHLPLKVLAGCMLVAYAPSAGIANDQPSKQVQADTKSEELLSVPVYPRGKIDSKIPEVSDLRDSYIIMKDGSIFTDADWILGALKKDRSGIGMSDYENKLFLGQVARAAAGLDESLINRSLSNTEPTILFKSEPLATPWLRPVEWASKEILHAFLPGRPVDWNPATSPNVFVPAAYSNGDATYYTDKWIYETDAEYNSDLKESGIMQIMLKDQRKRLQK